jgi:hypothetical protein
MEQVTLFLDANQYLLLFGITGGAKLLKLLEAQSAHLFVPRQVVDEVMRNKLGKASQFFINILGDQKKVAVPDHLLGIDPGELEKLRQAFDNANTARTDIRGYADDVLQRIGRSEDSVSRLLSRLFANSVVHTPEEVERARRRREHGNPPGKPDGPLGDQLIWEHLLSRCGSSAYIDRIRNMPDRSNVAGKVMNSPNAREQMEIALGSQRARELQSFTHVENIMDAARKATQGNSTTARQLVELGLAGGFGGLETGNNPLTDPEAFMHSALVFGALRGHAKVNENVAHQVAKLLMSNDLSRVNAGIKILSQHPALSTGVRNADATIASVVARGSLPTVERVH